MQQQSTQSEQQSDKVPSELTELENNIEMIIKTLGGPAVQEKQQGKQDTSSEQERKEPEKDQGGDKNKEKSQDKQRTQSQQEGQNEQKGQEQQKDQAPDTPQQPQQPQDSMEKAIPIINKLHYQWNSLSPKAVQEGAKNDLVDNFGNALNSLTETSISKNKTNTLLAANNVYSYIPDLYSLFKTKASPEIKRMRYYSRNLLQNYIN